MATTLYLTPFLSGLGTGTLAALPWRGWASTTSVTNTTASGTLIQATATGGGTALSWWEQVDSWSGATGNASGTFWAVEASAANNARLAVQVDHYASDGTTLKTAILARTNLGSGELPTTAAAQALAATAITAPSGLVAGDWIRTTLWVVNVGTMGAGTPGVTVSYGGPTASAAGDCSVTLPGTIARYSGGTDPNCLAIVPVHDASALTTRNYTVAAVTSGQGRTFTTTSYAGATNLITGVSGGDCTWAQLGTGHNDSGSDDSTLQAWVGVYNGSGSSTTVTVASSSASLTGFISDFSNMGSSLPTVTTAGADSGGGNSTSPSPGALTGGGSTKLAIMTLANIGGVSPSAVTANWVGTGPPTNNSHWAAFRVDPASETPAFTTVSTQWNTYAAVITPVSVKSGTVAGTFTFTGAVSGQSTHRGTVAGTDTFTGALSGRATHSGTTTGTDSWTGAVTGRSIHSGATAGSFTFTGAASGRHTSSGNVAGTDTWTGATSGHRTSSGTVAGTGTWTGAVSGRSTHSGAVAGHFTFTGSVTGRHTSNGTVAGSDTWTGATSGHVAKSGAVAGTDTWTGAVSGQTSKTGHVAGSFTFTGAVSSHKTSSGTTTGTDLWTGSTTGRATHSGTVAGTDTWTGAVSGTAPTVGGKSGTVSGHFTFTGSTSGARASSGTVTGSDTWTGATTGQRASRGHIIGGWVFTGQTTGQKHPSGVLAALYTFTGAVSGRSPNSGLIAGTFTFTGTVSGHNSGQSTPIHGQVTLNTATKTTVSLAARTSTSTRLAELITAAVHTSGPPGTVTLRTQVTAAVSATTA